MANEGKNESLFTRLFYAGVGLGAIAVEKLEKSVSKLIKENKVSLDDLKEHINRMVKDLAGKKDQLQKELDDYIQKFVEDMKFAKKKDLDELMKKLQELEKKLEKKNLPPKAEK